MSKRTLDTGTSDLEAHVEDGVAVIALNRPERRNALSAAMLTALDLGLGATLCACRPADMAAALDLPSDAQICPFGVLAVGCGWLFASGVTTGFGLGPFASSISSGVRYSSVKSAGWRGVDSSGHC